MITNAPMFQMRTLRFREVSSLASIRKGKSLKTCSACLTRLPMDSFSMEQGIIGVRCSSGGNVGRGQERRWPTLALPEVHEHPLGSKESLDFLLQPWNNGCSWWWPVWLHMSVPAFSLGSQNNHKKVFYKKKKCFFNMCQNQALASRLPVEVWVSHSLAFLLLFYDASLLGPSEPRTLPLLCMDCFSLEASSLDCSKCFWRAKSVCTSEC